MEKPYVKFVHQDLDLTLGGVALLLTGRVWYGWRLLNSLPRVQIPSAPFLLPEHIHISMK